MHADHDKFYSKLQHQSVERSRRLEAKIPKILLPTSSKMLTSVWYVMLRSLRMMQDKLKITIVLSKGLRSVTTTIQLLLEIKVKKKVHRTVEIYLGVEK